MRTPRLSQITTGKHADKNFSVSVVTDIRSGRYLYRI